MVADAKAVDLINTDRKTFDKPAGANAKAVDIWGPNLLNSTGSEWRRHRKIAAPAFSERNTRKVWDETIRITNEWFEERIGDGKTLQDTVHETEMLTLMIIAKAAFGCQLEWPSDSELGDTKLTLRETVSTVFKLFPLRFLVPRIFYSLPVKKPHHLDRCYAEFERQVFDLMQQRKAQKAEGVEGEHDLMSLLIDANEREEGNAVLSDKEVLSDTFVFMLAGHETSANTLGAALFLLSLYPEYQELIYEEVHPLIGDTSSSPASFDVYPSLRFTYATIQEVLRLIPPVTLNIKATLINAAIPASSWGANKSESPMSQVIVEGGTFIRCAIAQIGYIPLYWKDPYVFRPERFIEKPDLTAWIPFSSGVRGCIGIRFGQAEAVAALAQIVARYHIEVPPEVKEAYQPLPGESERDRRERLYNPQVIATLKPKGLRVALRKRAA